ncbi:unnamed protein product [Closterium sp. NIES-53]
MTTLRGLLHISAQHDYELHFLDSSTAFLHGSLHEKIWLHRPHGFTGSFPAGTRWSLRRPVYGLRQAPREWRTTLAALGFAPSTADPLLFLRTDTSLPPFYVFEFVDDLVFATADTEALTLVKSELQKRHICTNLGPSALRFPILLVTAHPSVYQPLALSFTFRRVRRAEWSVPRACGLPHVPDDVHSTRPRVPSQPPGSLRGSQQAPKGLHLQPRFRLCFLAVYPLVFDYTFEAEIYAGAMAAQELRWLTYLLTWESSLVCLQFCM